jgi:AraC-like DNA-binding protein
MLDIDFCNSIMAIGGQLEGGRVAGQVRLVRASSGVVPVEESGWRQTLLSRWVLDCFIHGRQQQRIRDGRAFVRQGGTAILFGPNTPFYERRWAGSSIEEAFITFDTGRTVARALRQFTDRAGYCLFRDPDGVLTGYATRVAGLLFHRKPGYVFAASGLALEAIGALFTSQRLGPQLRIVRSEPSPDDEEGLPGRVERFIRDHVAERLQVAHLARHVGMGISSFGHTYPRMAGESPYRTIVRLKLARAKELLLKEGLSVKETAYRLGFSSEYSFSRTFKQQEGLSPRAFVRALAGKRG